VAVGENDVAIVGMAARFPGAKNVREFWKNLIAGKESIVRYSNEELLANGESASKVRRPNYVPSGAPLDDMTMFDGEFFGFSPKESAILDPQHRHFLEVCWEALEDSAHPPERFGGPIGIFAGCGMGSYFYFNVCSNRDLVDSVGMFLLRHTGNDKDFLATRVSYLFDLRGPVINVQTACSTSLVAVHLASQSLLNREVDMALAGGVTIEIPHRRGYLFEPGEILSPDGHCHAFDHRAQGTVFGSGAGVVVLRRATDAIKDGDHIYAIIKSTAVNNDGARKVGYLAPSVDGQAAAIVEAMELGDVEPSSIGYVECHGTGTYMGDPIEVAALTQAFRRGGDANGWCRIGSVKTNIGHLDTAAGVASLIKASLAAKHGQIPPSLGYEKPNPTIEFDSSPFRVASELTEWKASVRRAAVNSLGVGGTNAFAIVEEPPAAKATGASKRPYDLLVLSARNRSSLDASSARLADRLEEDPSLPLPDVAYTLFEGRRHFSRRRVLTAKSREEAIALLRSRDETRVFTHAAVEGAASPVFMFPGGGSQYARMGHDLYRSEPVYKKAIDRGLEFLKRKRGEDYSRFFLDEPTDALGDELSKMHYQLPCIFLVEYALAELWRSFGVQPAALVGHSLGENTAACLAGVLSFEDALSLVLLRGELMNETAPGGMLSIPLPRKQVEELLGAEFDLSIVNAEELCAVSGPLAAIDRLEKELREREIDVQRLRIPIGAHSRLMDPILERFEAFLRSVKLEKPKIPFVSNRTGTWITEAQATDPKYWVEHLRNTVLFGECVNTVLDSPGRVLLEVGPGRTLSSLARMSKKSSVELNVVPSLRHRDEIVDDGIFFLTMLGRAFASGVPIDASTLWQPNDRKRLSLPTYAFSHQPYFIEPNRAVATEAAELEKKADVAEYGYAPFWARTSADPRAEELPGTWLLFLDDAGVGRRLSDRLREKGHTVVHVLPGDAFSKRSDTEYVISPERGREPYDLLMRELVQSGKSPTHIVHLWLVTASASFRPGSSVFHRNQEMGFFSLLFLCQALGDDSIPRPIELTALTNGALQVADEPVPHPEKATALGPIKVAPRELTDVSTRLVDVVLPSQQDRLFGGRLRNAIADPFAGRKRMTRELDALVDLLEEEVTSERASGVFAYRDGKRFEERFRPFRLDQAASDGLGLRDDGTYFITGGLGGLGLVVARFIAERARAKLVLVGRSGLPERTAWSEWRKTHSPSDPTSERIAAIEAIEALGSKVLVARADVTNVEDMQRALALTREAFGSVHGLIHTAGIVSDNLLPLKTVAEIEDVFAPKIHGTMVLDQLFGEEPLDFFVLYSSTSTVIAPPGQVDYVAANAYLNAYAQSRSGRNTHTVAINWGVWNEVGMAARATHRSHVDPEPPRPVDHPFFDVKTKDAWGEPVLEATYSPDTHWILDEHRTKAGTALIPGTGYIELIRAALAERGVEPPFEIRDLYFIRPLRVKDGEKKVVRVRLRETDVGYTVEVRSECSIEGQRAWELHALGQVASIKETEAPEKVDLATVASRCTNRIEKDENGLRSSQEAHLAFGPRWRVLTSMRIGDGEALGELRLPRAFHGDLDRIGLHPALLDYATGFAMDLVGDYSDDELWVPISYDTVRVRGKIGASIRSWVRNSAASGADFHAFDIAITDEAGEPLVLIDRFSIKRLPSNVLFASEVQPSFADVEREPEGNAQLSPAAEQLQRSVALGILPEEGADALGRVLAGDRKPVVVVSSMDLARLKEQTSKVSTNRAAGGTKFARPDLESEYVAPADDLERTLVGFWEELLGVENVGTRDSFFDLGGHSLVAVRLFAKIKKAYNADFPISVLFEAPTIEACARLVRDAIGVTGDAPKTRAAPRARYTHLVAMHPGDGGPKTPFFLVAGMFGNVLNLRHLAHLLGTDRRFYGLQARGLYGDQAPHDTFEEMASAYIEEIRMVQPHGPYFLGGFSGGGITAFEIAKQLRAVGEETALLVFLDTRLPVQESLTMADRAAVQLHRLRRQGVGYVGEWAQNRWNWEVSRLRSRFEKVEERRADEFHNDAVRDAFMRATERYALTRQPGRIALFRPKLDRYYELSGGRALSHEKNWVMEDNGWGPWADGVDIFEVPGDHDSMVLEPNVRVIAQRLRECIDAAEPPEKREPAETGRRSEAAE
jgi:acyl transferase domain-containing protein/thioesterase domain-containing protein/acyl carrier protein